MRSRVALITFFSDIFIYVLEFKKKLASGEHPDYASVQEEVKKLIDSAEQKNLQEPDEFHKINKHYEDEKYQMALFAVVAFLDEQIVSSGWLYKKEWSKNLLQKTIFMTMTAGSEFFQRLDDIREVATEDERNIIEVYYYCLVLGYEGIFYNDLSMIKSTTDMLYNKIYRYDQVFNKHLMPKKPKKAEKIIREFRINTSTFISLYLGGIGIFFTVSFWIFAVSLSSTLDFLLKVFAV